MTGTELVDLRKLRGDKPGFITCYAGGSVFKPDGAQFRVEKGRARLISRALCVEQFYGNRCKRCPHSQAVVTVAARAQDGT